MLSDVLKSFAQRMKDLRKEKHLSQEDLALQCGIDRTYVGRIERLERTPSLEIVSKIAKGFNMSLSELLNF